jgi:RHS repeat-associated protein
VRGQVTGTNAAPIPVVEIGVLGHPEFGKTLSRSDGWFDLVVNGGGPLTFTYTKDNYLPVQRAVTVAWQDTVTLPGVVLTQIDPQPNIVSFPVASAFVAAQASHPSDDGNGNGMRTATLLVPSGTTATMKFKDGSTQQPQSADIRLTEYTVGDTGPAAMPGDLPANIAYTYAIDLSTTAALSNPNVIRVDFSQPLPFYVTNFLNFPIGTTVPLGFYDRELGQWVASESGNVIKYVSTAGDGSANIDTDGVGGADNTGLTVAERQQIATYYTVGTSLWRVTIPHFSAWDTNWPFSPPPDATKPKPDPPTGDGPPPPDPPPPDPKDGPGPPLGPDPPPPARRKNCGSIIGCQDQTLGQSVPILGTPYELRYQSDRVAGRVAARTLTIPLRGATPVPASLVSIDIDIRVAGKQITDSVSPSQSTYTFQWDGEDAYGRTIQGPVPAVIRVGYVYQGVYQKVAKFGGVPTGTITGSVTRQEVTFWNEQRHTLGIWDARGVGLGGWSVNRHHVFTPNSATLYFGNGSQRQTGDVSGPVITRIAGTGVHNFNGDNIDATSAQLWIPDDVAIGSDGIVYIADEAQERIRRIGNDGKITTVAGTGTQCSSSTSACGDGGQATSAQLNLPHSVVVATDGNLIIADMQNRRIRRVDAQTGIISTLAGTGVQCPANSLAGTCGDDGPALQATFTQPSDLAVGPDGSIYVADQVSHRIRRITTDGIVSNFAGTGVQGSTADPGPAASARFNRPHGIAVGADGTLYIGDRTNNRIRSVGVDGIVRTIAGDGTDAITGDGVLAVDAQVAEPKGLVVGPDGSLYFSDNKQNASPPINVVRRIRPDGVIVTVEGAGNGGDDGPAVVAGFTDPQGLAVGPDGSLYIAFTTGAKVRRVASAFPTIGASDIVLPSENGRELYRFDKFGRHLSTRDAFTGTIRETFGYDTAGRIWTITDRDGNVTTVQRSTNGSPLAIVAPGGQHATLGVDASGYVASIANDAAESAGATFLPDGLMTAFTTPRQYTSTFSYDPVGKRLTSDHDPDPTHNPRTYARTDTAQGYIVTEQSPLARVATDSVAGLASGGTQFVSVAPTGLSTSTLIDTSGTYSRVDPDGLATSYASVPDPRFGMLAPLFSRSIVTPLGRTFARTVSRQLATDPGDPSMLTSLHQVLTLNGRAFTIDYARDPTRTVIYTSAGGRTRTLTIDAHGHITSDARSGLAGVTGGYGGQFPGSFDSITAGSGSDVRTYTLHYDALRRIDKVTDPMARDILVEYDAADRINKLTLPGGRISAFGYDADGNLTSVTPPPVGHPSHTFSYTSADLDSTYTPPAVAGTGSTGYVYNADRQLELINLPDGQTTIDPEYDATTGRLATVTVPGGIYTYDYYGANEAPPGTPGGAPGAAKAITTTVPLTSALGFAYDGPLLTQTTWTGLVPSPVTVSRTYDNDFHVATTTVNGTSPIAFVHGDADGLLTQAGAATLTRNGPQGGVSKVEMGQAGAQLDETRTYSTFGELASISATFNGMSLLNLTYPLRDSLGRIVQQTEAVNNGSTTTIVYGYDPAGRLQDVTRNADPSSSYAYDLNGNRQAAPGLSGSPEYDNQDRLRQYNGTTYDYTANGELLQTTTVGSAVTTYQYDVLGNLRQVALPNGVVVDYVIDAANRRVGKRLTVNSNSTLLQAFLYDDQLRVAAELDATGAVRSRFVYGSRANVPDYLVNNAGTYRILADHLGSPRLVVNVATGAVAQRIDYDEFGRATLIQGTWDIQPFGFAGGLYDPDTGLLRFGARDYDPGVGRWTAKDPILFQGGDLNLYGYVVGDPVNGLDPNGMQWFRTFTAPLAPGGPGAFTGGFVGAGIGAGLGIASGVPFGAFGGAVVGGLSDAK